MTDTATTATVTIPAAIDRRLGLNGRLHWSKKAKLVKELKETAFTAMLATPRHTLPPTPWLIDYEIGLKRGQKRMDDDNAVGALKALRDGIAEYAGIDDKNIRSGELTWARDPRGGGYVTVTIRGVE